MISIGSNRWTSVVLLAALALGLAVGCGRYGAPRRSGSISASRTPSADALSRVPGTAKSGGQSSEGLPTAPDAECEEPEEEANP